MNETLAAALIPPTQTPSADDLRIESLPVLLGPDWQMLTVPNVYRISMAGIRCPRALYFRSETILASPKPVRSDLVERAIDHLMVAGDAQARAVDIQQRGIRARGIADLVLEDFRQEMREIVVRFHLIADADWERVRHRELEEHRAEVNLLAYGASASYWSVCYLRASTGEIREHRGAMSPVSADWVLERFEDVAEYRRRKVPPRCPYESGDRGEKPCTCRWTRVSP